MSWKPSAVVAGGQPYPKRRTNEQTGNAMKTKLSPPRREKSASVPSSPKRSQARGMLIDGRWVQAASGETFPTYDPATGEVICQAPSGDKADIDAAVQAARAAFENGPWRRMTASERGRLIWKLADLLERDLEEFAALESLDNGKPLTVARVADVPLAVDLFRYMAGWCTKIHGDTFPISVPYAPGRNSSPTRCASRSASSARSSRGISRCSWRPGNSGRRSPPDAASCSSPPSKRRFRRCGWAS